MIRKLVLPSLLALALPASAALVPASVTTTGEAVSTVVLDDQSTVVKFLADGTITIPDDVTARILVVGGGGGGGGDCAPGGGGGGVIDRSGVTLRAGVYSVVVGGGGTGGSGTGVKGKNGGDTSLMRDGADEPLALAYGGGGAGAWKNGAGLDGGCGGGGWGNPGQGVAGQGYPATAQEGDSPGGGGGAGGSPVAVNIGRGNSTQRQADGGPGRASDITGTTEYYGPGGGSGGFNGLAGWGGDQSTLATEGWIWGCGWSHSSAMTDAAMVEAGLKQQGRDGYGGGGGGSSNSHYAGGNGGSGVLILRIDPVVPSPQPAISVSVESTGANPAVRVLLASVGADAETAGVSFQTALSAAGLDAAATNVAAAAATAGQTVSIPLSSYPAALTFHVRVVAKNDLGVFSAPVETTFRLPDLPVGAAAEGGDTVVQLSGASHDVVHTFTQSGTFTLSEATEVRYLVVGGGGAGGQTQNNNSGGGGGAGGFLTGTTNLAAGTYTITVGAGGQALSADGSPSSIAGDGGFAITALGGGGGGKGNEAGRAGASGGGGGSQAGRTNGGAGTAGQGFGGGDGGVGTNWVAGSYTEMTGDRVTNLDTMAGGGGGAGGPGECGTVDSHNNCNGAQYGGYQRDYHGGNGGPGLPSDITGEEVWYAGGGGGGVWHDETYVAFGGAGGKGGGGMGDWSLLPQADIDGKPNSGGGGGGQGRGDGRADPIYWGKGGSGIVVLRYAPAGDAVGLDPIETALGATSATVTAWTAGAGVAEEVRWGTDPADLSNTAAVSGGTATLSPLVPGTTYYAQAAGGGLSGKVVEFLARPWPSYLSDSVQPSTVGALDYLVTFTAGGAFTLTTPATVRALLVGGGGGGGCNAGGGGGAGGMLEVSDFVLEPGSYTVRIGAGGAASTASSATGAKGGDTVLLRDGQPVLRAYGGGGGQSWECYGEAALATSTGGSGGGNTRQDKPGTYIDPAQGNPGGPSINCQGRGDWDGQPGGGGGAGGRGLSMLRYPEDSNRHNGDGGPGRASDITGASVVYAAGGGASWGGNWGDSLAGSGGREGSGHGVRKGAAAKTGDENGLPNTGDGGGGGSTTIAGGAGGSGILVLRFARDPDAPGLSDAAVVENVLRLDGSVVCEDDGARVTYRIAGPGEDVFAATPVVLTESSTAGETLSFTETGLVGDALYTVLFEAVKNGHAALPLQFTATPFALDPAFTPSEPANDARSRVGADEVHVLSASGTFTLATARRVRLLAVGGGGGAGWGSQWGGGGGGAGGLLELPGIVLRAGTYRYEVGAGGAPGKTDTTKGGNGGSTVLFYIDPETQAETEVVRVAGGGGSGATNDGWRDGLDGGSGGGAVFWELNYSRWGKPGKGLAGQGHDGGGWTSSPGGVVGSSGGGGAGAPGQTGTATKGGDGGDGLPSDITGVEVWYAGGGGASARNNDANVRTVGKGGKGGGGHGADYGDYTPDPGRDGVDGLGGGGGGGLAWYIAGGPSRWYDCFGGRGGAGTLILRFVAAPTDAPVLAGVTATLKDAKTATFTGTVEWVGDGASTADLVLAAGGASETVATGLATGADFSFETAVEPGATFAWSLKLVNSVNVESAAVSGSIAVPADAPVAIAATGAELRSVGIDTVAIFTNTAAVGSFTVPAGGAWVEMLVVGGGGAGGVYWDSHGGAGGGAGGFVHEPALFLEEGVYTVTVGEGGKGREDGTWDGSSWPGKPGSPSFVQHGGADVARALGGSGGASRYSGNCTNYYAGSPSFASTGGAMPVSTSNVGYLDVDAQPGTPGQGNPGGAGRRATVTNSSGSGTYLFAGGGGGAGAKGGDGDPVAMAFGDGGDGLPCSITGEEVWYAGGGGCGSAYKAPGSLVAAATKGGRGGGGYGQRWQSATDPDNRGVNGLGGGGGGGGGKDGNSNGAANCPSGHSGGSGTVIVRWRSMAESAIVVEPGEPVGGFRRGTFAGTVTAAGVDGATVDVEIGVAPAGAATTNWTTVATGLAAGDAFSASVDGLADGTEYVAAWRATNGSGGTATGDAGAFATFAGAYLVPGSEAAGATVTQVGNDSVYTYSNPATAGSFTVETPGYARVLVAGGGGAGGYRRGGGGGGGGVIEEELVWFEAGTYSVSVGAGGAPSTGSGSRGGAGGDTVVTFGGAELWRAYGGGGGGSWDDGAAGLGGNGGSGGGSARRRETTAGTPVDPAQGHAGAPSRRRDLGKVEDYWSAGGGGGAGSPGLQASADHTVAGAGGAGRVSDISGSPEQYGAGGGASCTHLDTKAAGEGGDGIGGHGRRTSNTQSWIGDEPGRAGYGGGGGGGGDSNANGNFIYAGAPGGCGTVVIRFANDPAGLPDAAVFALEPSKTDPTAVDATIFVRSLGGASSATLELAYGASQDSLPLRHAVGTVDAAGTVDATLPGLEPGRTYYVAAAISTPAGETVTRAMAVTLPPANAGSGSAGLWQTAWGGSTALPDGEIWTRSAVSNVVAGAIAAIGKGDAVDPLSGESYSWSSAPWLFLYKGVVFLKGGTTYTFGSRMDDTVRLAIGGTTLLDLAASPATTSFADFTAPWTGWYPVEIRLGNATGGITTHGPDGDGLATWADFALAFNTEGNRTMMPASAWTTLLDPGDGSLLRPEDPGLRYADTDVSATAGGSLTLAASVAPGNTAVHAYLCSGPAWAGTPAGLEGLAPLEVLAALENLGWTAADLGEVAAADAATSLGEVQVPGWGSSAKVAAVALVHPDGTVTWSDPVTYAGTSLLSLSAAATDWSQGDELEVSWTVSGGTGPYTATLYVGNGPGSLAAAATATLSAAGTGTLRATGLVPSATYYWQVVVTDAAGGSAATDDSAHVAMPGAAEILNSSLGISWSIDQRTATLKGNLKTLGAGDNWAYLYVTDRLLERWPNDIRAFRGSTTNTEVKVRLTQTGPFSITHTFDWNQEIGFNWVLSNSNGRVTWIGSRKPDWDGNAAASQSHFWTGDYQTYEWAGGSGAWNDASMWTGDGTMEGHEQAGYPVTGSYATFPAGEHEVTVPAEGDKVELGVSLFRPTTLKLQKDAKVTIRGTEGGARFDLRQIDTPLRQGYVSFAEGAQLVLSGVRGVWNPRRENGSSLYFGGPNTLFEVTDGSEITIGGNGLNQWTVHSWEASRDGRRFVFSNGSRTTVRGEMLLNGKQELVVDDATLAMEENSGSWEYSRIHFGFVSPGRFVLRGAHPLVLANNSISVDAGSNPSSDAEQYIDFEIPAGGFAETPIRCRAGNTTLFGRDANKNRRMVLRVAADSPAASAKGVLDQPLVWWPAGKTEWTVLDPANLPHPDTDRWYDVYDPATGAFTGWGVRIVGRPEIGEPQIVGLAMTNIVEGSAGLEFYGIPGTNSAAATFSVSIERTDAAGTPVAALSPNGTVSAGTRFSISATGLEEGGSYLVTVTGADPDDPASTCTETIAFDALRDYAAASASADAVVTQDGPYTVWTFTNAAAAGTFSVTRPGWAEVLVVGGGGSGGGGSWWNCGGGGGGGGQVVATNLYFVPGVYPVVVGEGAPAPSGSREQSGSRGQGSGFAGIEAAGGGYGSSNGKSAGGSGASGGGGSGSSMAGGAATAGFPGGKGATAGGGGGGAGGAGADASGIVGGDGGAGYETDISGEWRVYGAGGGGGAGQGTGTAGGAPGGPTAGTGAAFTAAWYDADLVAALIHATPGFGGGGGGGTSCNSSSTENSGAMRGGAGGSGTVIVRMRTATAHDPAPQAALKGVEPDVASVGITLSVFTLGEGAASATATLLVAPEGSAATNAFPAGTLVSTGWTNLVARGLRPATSYAGVLRLDSGLPGGVRDLPVAFETTPESNDPLVGSSTYAWTNTGGWSTDAPPFEDNLLRAATYAVSSTKWTGSTKYLSDGAFTTQNNGCGLGSGNTVTWTLAEPSDISRIRAYAYWSNDNWMKIAIESVSFRDESGEWTTLENSGTVHSFGDTTQSAELSATEPGKALFPRATGIRIAFARNPSRDGTIYHEFEAFGPEADDLPPDLSVLSVTRTADRLAAVVGLSRPMPTNAVATAYLASVHGAEDPAAWTVAATAPIVKGAVAQSFSIPAADLAGMTYLRFRYVDESGISRWSESVYLPDLEVLASVPPAVAFSRVAGATADTATIASILVDAGTGAQGGAADVYLQYSLLSGAFDGLSGAWDGDERLLASGVTAGATNLVATGLRPGRDYTARLVARNAAGGEGVSRVFSFSTPVEQDFTGGEWGLRQAMFTNVSAFETRNLPTVPADADVVEGVIMADTSRYGHSTKRNEDYDWGDQQKNCGFAYDGAIFLEAGKTYTFGENFDDGVRIEIDGEAVLDNRDYTKAAYGDYACTRTGWHRFRLWLFQDYGGVGWRTDRFDGHSVAWNTAGVKATGANPAWRDFIDPGDGSLLWSVFPRMPVVESFDRDGDALVLSVSLPAAEGPCALYAVWGEANSGADETAWDHSQLVEAEVPAEAQTLSFRIADASEAAVVRFYTRDAAGATAWSESCYPDFSAPIVRNGGVVHDGDRATVTANLLSVGEGDLVLAVQWADNAAMEDARSQAIATSGPGVYTATIEVEPGATTWYRLVARTRGGAADVTPVSSFTTLAGSVLAATASPSGLSHHTVSLNGSLAVLGAGETEVWLYAGTDPSALEALDSRVLVSTGSFSFQQTFPGDPHQVWFAFRSVNVAPGGASWESWSATGSVTTVDSVTYTWRQDVSEGAWNNPSNWIPSASADDCIGYPDHRNAAVDFPNGTVATVTVPGKYRFGGWSVARDDVDLTFVGFGPAVSGLGNNSDNIGGGAWRNSTMTFANLSLAEYDGINFGDPNKPAESRDSTLRFTDGAVASFGNAITAAGSNMWIVVDGGATLGFRSNGPALEVKDGGIRLDGGTITAARILTDYNWAQTTNQTILVSGAAPRIELTTAFRNSSDAAASLQNADTAFLFTVPKDGWADAAIFSGSSAEAFGGMLGGGEGRYVLSLDPKSGVFLREGAHAVPLVAWAGGIDTNRVALAPAPENAELVWTYGWPSDRTAPATAGEAPTGVRAVVQGANLSVASVEAAEGGVLATVSLDEYDAGAAGFSVSIEVSSSPDGFADPDFAFAYAGNPATEPGDFGILASGLVPATPYWVRAVVAPAGGGTPSYSAVRPLCSGGEGRIAFAGAGATSLSARATLAAAGAGSAGALARLEVSRTADFAALCAASREIRIADGADATLTAEDLDPATEHWLRVRFTNDRGFVFYATDTVARATLPDPVDRAIVFVPGLVQAKLSGGSNWADDVWTHATAVHVPGMLMALTTQEAVNPYDGKEYNWGDNQTWGYVGQMWMEGGRTYWFARNIDDRTYAKIDGTVVFGNASTASFTPAATGWHDVDFRAGNDGGGHGPNSGTIGFGWNADGISSFTTETFKDGGPWTKAMDPGDGTLLRVVYSSTPFMAIDSVAVEDGTLSVTASFAGIPTGSASFEAFYGIEDCGIVEGKWTGHCVVTTPPPGDTASATYAVPGAGGAAFVIFRLSGTDAAGTPWRQWSRVYDVAPGRPSFRLEGGLVAFTNLGWTAFCTGIGDGAATVAAELQLSTEADFSVTNQAVSFPYDGVGAADLAFAGLETNRVYYARVAGVNDRGEWGYSGTLERRTLLPGPPVTTILPASAGFMSGSWYATLNDFGFGGARADLWIEVSESGEFDDSIVVGGFDVDAVPFTTDEAVVATGLRPGTLYKVRTHARNDWGVEGVSAAIDLKTRDEPFVMTDVGSIAGAAGATTLTIECVQLEPGTLYFVTFSVDDSSIRSVGNLTDVGTYSAVHYGEAGSTHTAVVSVEGRLDGKVYRRTYQKTFVVGENAYAIGSLRDLRGIPMRVGDRLVLPALTAADDHYVLLDIRPFELLEDGRTIRAVEPGFTAVAAYEYDPLQDALVRNETMGLAICLPESKGRVFVAKETTSDWNWSDASKWINATDPEAAPAYPNGVGDVAMAPLAKDKTLALDVNATVGALYIGWDAAVPPSGSVRLGGAGGTLTFRTGERDKPGLLRITGLGRWDVIQDQPFFYLGGNASSKRLGLAVPDGLDFDGGKHPDRVDLALRDNHNRIIFRSEYGLPLEVPAGKTLRLFNFDHAWYGGDGQMPNTSRIIWSSGFPFAGDGTIVYDGPVGYFDSALRDFDGTLVIRQGQRFDACGVDSRGGGFWLKANQGYASPRSVFRIEGEVPYSDSLGNAVGLATWGSTHGWGAWGPGDNSFGGRAMVFAGGTLLQRGNNERDNAWQNAGIYKNPNRSDALVVAEGFSSIDQTSFNSSVPTNRMEFASLRHENRGTIRISTTDTGTYGGSIPETQSHCIVHGFAEHAVGGGGAPGSGRESIVPWIVSAVQWSDRLYFPFLGERDGETDCLVRGLTHPTSKAPGSALPDENVFASGTNILLAADATVNSLCLNNNWSKGTALGAGRTLTISSGGLVLEGDRSAVGREEDAERGEAGTLLFPREAYVYSTRQSLSEPNEIWARIVAPQGLAISFPGYLRIGGDQTGIDGELVVNGCDVTLGSATAGCRIDVPVRLESGAATLRIGKAGSFCRRPLFLNDHAGFGPKFVACPGTVEKVGMTYVNGVNLRKGLYGSSESGADIVDDNHFAGTGLVRVCTDETDKTSILILR